MSSRLITLTTDFGTSDHFVGAMKGVIAAIAPTARVVDITHEITPYNILEAAFVIAQAAPYFPKGAIHLIVVDPGVGSGRRAVLAEAGGQFFVAPDNGVLSMVLARGPHKVRAISNVKLALKHVSRTFHGRDIFAPAAAHLARGAKPAQFGKLIHDHVRIEGIGPVEIGPNAWRGAILKADRFGNLITNFHVEEFSAIKTNPFVVRVGGAQIRRLALTFADTKRGELAVVVGSSGYLEIVANQASAAHQLDCVAGAPLGLEFDSR
ncbi:MAG TPA: SAM-dependent chlorinase/fluorinase [Bryobacteraceae bacterium]|nr:SAM-dependent chlorinase/fluorinase [Bryobacteraceae bacterium]